MNALVARKARKLYLQDERGRGLEPGGVEEPELSAEERLRRENELVLNEVLPTR